MLFLLISTGLWFSIAFVVVFIMKMCGCMHFCWEELCRLFCFARYLPSIKIPHACRTPSVDGCARAHLLMVSNFKEMAILVVWVSKDLFAHLPGFHAFFVFVYVSSWMYTSPASGQGRCKINNGGCWQDTKEGKTFSACSVSNKVMFWYSSHVLSLREV